MIVKTVEEAEAWFLKNSEGTVTVERPDGAQKKVGTFSEAVDFLTEDRFRAHNDGVPEKYEDTGHA